MWPHARICTLGYGCEQLDGYQNEWPDYLCCISFGMIAIAHGGVNHVRT
jgi:hypothetical protein